MLGTEAALSFSMDEWPVRCFSKTECDITNRQSVIDACDGARLIINCAAYTDVEGAEVDSQRAFEVNTDGAENVARVAALVGSKLIHLSTDYVFDSLAGYKPALETCQPRPFGAYARSKGVGERLVAICRPGAWIVRTSSLYGPGKNFFSTIIERAHAQQPLRVVDDQVTAPTSARDLAEQLVALVDADAESGVYHATASGSTTWYEAARFALDHLGLHSVPITPISTAEHGGLAPRPAYSILANNKLKLLRIHRMRPWRIALAEWLDRTYRNGSSASAT